MLPAGGTAWLYLDDGGDVVERSDLARTGGEESELALKASAEQPLLMLPASPRDVLACVVKQVYVLEPVSVAEGLEHALTERYWV